MRKRLFCYAFAALCAAAVLPSCSNDDNDTPDYTQVIEDQIAGEYKGKLDIMVDGQLLSGDGVAKNITVEKASASAITLSIKDFSFSGITIGDINMENCELMAKGEDYTFTNMQELEVPGLTCTINATGTLKKDGAIELVMDIDAKLGEIQQKVKVTYTGTRLKGDENKEAKILSFTFDVANGKNACVIEQPIIGEGNTITFRVDEAQVEANPDLLKGLEPTIKFSEGATHTTSLDQNGFSKDVTYTVISEDGKVTTIYKVKAPERNSLDRYTFDEWESTTEKDIAQQPHTWLTPAPKEILATSNGGAINAIIFAPELELGLPVGQETEGFSNSAVKLVTLDAHKSEILKQMSPVVSGSLFTGQFVMGNPLLGEDPLTFTHFGLKYEKRPLIFKGWYKYTSGTPFIKAVYGEYGIESVEVTQDVDECSIQAVLYEVASYDETLDGTNINTSDKIVAKAQLADGSAKADWTEFSISFVWENGKEYSKDKKYKLAIVCSSSKNGDKFCGGANSTLWVDELEVIGE